MKNKVVVTGANGFVGKILCEELVQRGYSVYAFIRNKLEISNPNIEYVIYSDLTNLGEFREYFKGCHAVIHLAAKVHIKDARDIAEYRHINTQGTIHLAKIAESEGVNKFIYLSTIKVNGEGGNHITYSQNSIPQPTDAYAISKWEAEQALLDIHGSTSMDVTILRPVLMYGPSVKGNLRTLMKVISTGLPLPLANVNNTRSLLNIRNLNHLICECLVNERSAGRTFLVADGQDVSTTELVSLLATAMNAPARLFGLPVSLVRIATRLLGKKGIYDRLYGSLQVDIDETRRVLGWKPPYTIEAGMREMTIEFQDKMSQTGKR